MFEPVTSELSAPRASAAPSPFKPQGEFRSHTQLIRLALIPNPRLCLHQAINSAKTKIPPTGFDPVSSGSWCDNHPQFGPSLVNNGEDGVLRRASTALQRVKSVLVERWTIPCGWKFHWKILCLDLFINHLQIPAWIPYLHLQFLLHASLIYITI